MRQLIYEKAGFTIRLAFRDRTVAYTRAELCMIETQDHLNKIHKLGGKCFKHQQQVYHWVAGIFKKYTHEMDTEELASVVACLESKRDQYMCTVHGRVHGKPKKKKKV